MTVDDLPLDVLDSGHEPDRRRRAALAVLLAVLLVLAAGGWYLDQRSRQAEFDAVSDCARRAAGEYRESTAQLAAMAEYVRPSLVFATEPTANELYGMVADRAIGTTGGLQQVRDSCAALEVHRWHPSQRAALAAQLSFQDAQLDALAATATDGHVYYQDRTSVPRAAAASALAAARPTTPW